MDEQASLLPILKDRFFDDIEVLHRKCGSWDLVIFSGDLTQSGKVEEFQKVDRFLDQLWERFAKLGFQPQFLAVPGNHDLVRPAAEDPEVKLLRMWANDLEVRTAFWKKPDSRYRTTVETAFRNYQEWWSKAAHKAPTQPGMLPGDFSATIEKDGARIGIVGLNSTFLQLTAGDYTGKLALDALQFQAACGGDGPAWVKRHDACLLVTHQPPNWLGPESLEQLRGEIAGYGFFVAHLFGHMHEARYESSAVGGADVYRTSQATSLFGLEYFGETKTERRHGYAAGHLELLGDTGSYCLWPRKAKRPGGQWQFTADTDDFILTDEHLNESFKLLRSAQPPAPIPVSEPPIPPPEPGDSPFPKKWAVLIGVNEYSLVAKLNYCRNDVVELAQTFREKLEFPEDCVFEFHEKSELKPERLQIFRKLEELRKSAKVGPDDLLIFYFSGHGMNTDGKDYLLPIEASASDVENQGIPVENLVNALQKIGCKNTAMFIDACREPVMEPVSGVKGVASIGADSADVISKAGIVAFLSCDPRDRSFEIESLQHGSFTYCILEAIKQGFETVSDLDSYLKTAVPQVNTRYAKPTQQPYAVIQPAERGSLKILYNRQRRVVASQQFDELMLGLLSLLEEERISKEDFNAAAGFLDQLKGKAQPDKDDKTKLHLLRSVVDGTLPPGAFHSAWKMKQLPRSAGPQIQKLRPLGGQP
jgi:hypothetical protein